MDKIANNEIPPFQLKYKKVEKVVIDSSVEGFAEYARAQMRAAADLAEDEFDFEDFSDTTGWE